MSAKTVLLNKACQFDRPLNYKPGFKTHYALPYEPPTKQKYFKKTDWRKYDSLIFDQGNEGSCTANAAAKMNDYLRLLRWRIANHGYTLAQFRAFVQTFVPDSRDFLYACELIHDGNFGQDAGSFGSTAAWVYQNIGCCLESIEPYTAMGYKDYPTQQAFELAAMNKAIPYSVPDTTALRYCLSEGYTVIGGTPVFPSWIYNPLAMRSGDVPDPGMFETAEGGHEMMFIGHDDDLERYLVANSWGTGVGKSGYFTFSYRYVEKYWSDFQTFRLPELPNMTRKVA